MQFILSHYGHRFITHAARYYADRSRPLPGEFQPLADLLRDAVAPCEGADLLESFVPRKMVEAVDDGATAHDVRLRYARNPLEHMKRVVFEYTTVCNLDCKHCRNSNLEAEAENDPVRLRRVVHAMLPLGIDRFDFIGGEVTKFGKGWLDLVSYARDEGAKQAVVITNGWFLGARDFLAAGERFDNDRAYLRALKERGLTHVTFSLDGVEEVHDACREVPGLYARILDGFDKTRAAGLIPRVSLVVGLGMKREEVQPWIAELSERLYGPSGDEVAAVRRLIADSTNYVSNFIDVGGGVQLRRSRAEAERFTDEQLRCKNFFRPSPTFRVKASGEISLCPLIEGGDGYGNVHEHDVVDLLNRMHESVVYQIHANKTVGSYKRFLDPEVFAGQLGHVCAMRTALNMIAQRVHAQGVSESDHAAVRAINIDVAERMGVRARVVKNRANGHAHTP